MHLLLKPVSSRCTQHEKQLLFLPVVIIFFFFTMHMYSALKLFFPSDIILLRYYPTGHAKVHNPRAILSLLKLILFLVHEFTSYPNYMQYT